jgi:hypothetical protein
MMEQEVVEVVDKYRKGLLDKEIMALSGSGSLSKDNISPSKVVEIINKKRKEDKEKELIKSLFGLYWS